MLAVVLGETINRLSSTIVVKANVIDYQLIKIMFFSISTQI